MIEDLKKEEMAIFFRGLFEKKGLYRDVSEKDVAWARYEIKALKAKVVCDVASKEMDICKLQDDWERYNQAMKDFNRGLAMYAESDLFFKEWERIIT